MAKDELTLKEKEILQHHFGDADFFSALDHMLSIEKETWEQRMKNAAKSGAEASEPIQRLLVINEAAAKASIYDLFFVTLGNRTGVKFNGK